MYALIIVAALGDWTEFRGPTGEGQSSARGVPTEWGPGKETWKAEVPGMGWSSPVVAAGKVYLTTALGETDLDLQVLCLDAKDGKQVWSTTVFNKKAVKMHNKNSQASPTVIVANGRIYAHFGHYGTACLDLDGKVLWRNDKLAFAPVHGNGGSPVLVDGLLVFTRDGLPVRELVALDASTGEVKWQTKRTPAPGNNPFSFGTPLVITVNGKKQIVSPASGLVGGYDVATGKEIWHVKYTGYSVIPRPVFAHGLLFLSTGYNTPSALAIDPTGKGGDVTATHLKWQTSKNAPHTPSMLVVGDELYMVSDSGFATCLDAKTGTVHWTQRMPGKGYSASPVAVGGKVYFLSEDGVGTVIEASKEYKLVARNEMKERTLASYAVTDGTLYVRTAKALYRFGKE